MTAGEENAGIGRIWSGDFINDISQRMRILEFGENRIIVVHNRFIFTWHGPLFQLYHIP